MGASAWAYITPYRGGMKATLAALHEEVFAELYGGGGEFGSLAELWTQQRFTAGEGTRSILDVRRVLRTSEPPRMSRLSDHGTLRPLRAERVVHHLGSERPTVEQFREALERPEFTAEQGQRWTGLYVLLHTDGEVTHVGVFGSSGD